MSAYYSENDGFASAWIARLIEAGAITGGCLDERSIEDVTGEGLSEYERCHFFAGIAGWDLALSLAGWEGPAWTGSCPCQPFSAAGKRAGVEDPRHLWPEFRRLISECRPPVIFGEQVASADGRLWLSAVRADLEALGYAVGAADLCAAGVGAPHIRQRLYWVADLQCDSERSGRRPHGQETKRAPVHASGRGETDGLGDPDHAGLEGRGERRDGACGRAPWSGGLGGWVEAVWHPCRDGKLRAISPEPEVFPLAPRIPGRVGQVRGAGNSIVPILAATFVRAFMGAR